MTLLFVSFREEAYYSVEMIVGELPYAFSFSSAFMSLIRRVVFMQGARKQKSAPNRPVAFGANSEHRLGTD